MLELNQVYQGDCLEVMKDIDDKSIDMILCDLPYGTTACKWDTIIPFEPLWKQYKRIIKDNGAIVLTASQPFTSKLVMSNISEYKHHWIWEKEKGSGFQVAKYRPMMKTEDIIVFSNKLNYNPIMEKRKKTIRYSYPTIKSKSNPIANYNSKIVESDYKYPENIIKVSVERGLHPTQKPVALFEYLIKTYTNKGDLVLDNTAGSGTTGVAARNLKRDFILIEQDKDYCNLINKRLAGEYIETAREKSQPKPLSMLEMIKRKND